MVKVFRHYIPLTHILLVSLDALVFFGSVYLGSLARDLATQDIQATQSDYLFWKAIFFMLVMLVSMVIMGMYRRHLRCQSMLDLFMRVIFGFSLGLILFSILFYVYPGFFIRRGVLAFSIIFSFIGIALVRWLTNKLSSNEMFKRRVLVVGAGKNASQLETLRRKVDRYGFELVGFVHVYGEHDVIDKSKIIMPESSLLELALKHAIDEIVVAVDDRRKSFPVDEILECKMDGIDITDLVTFFERQTGKIKLDALHPSSLIFTEGYNKILASHISKRLFDIVVSLLMLVLASPVMLFAAISIFIESRGNGRIIYRQDRVGINGKTFKLLKFRTMDENAEADGKPRWSTFDDERMTSNGKVLRHLRIDETPQLINVLLGDMSLVGPRPERPEFVDQLSQIIPFYNMRHKVKPGITGWAQISYPYGSSDKDAIEKLQFDLYYMKNYSILFDTFVLLQTAAAIFFGSSSGRGR